MASSVLSTTIALILMAAFSPIIIFSLAPITYLDSTVLFSLLVLMLAFFAVIWVVRGIAYRRSVPRDSRRNEVSLDSALFRTVSASVNCPRCDANLDLRSIDKDKVYVCGYCGATGTVGVIDKSEQRGSGGGRSI